MVANKHEAQPLSSSHLWEEPSVTFSANRRSQKKPSNANPWNKGMPNTTRKRPSGTWMAKKSMGQKPGTFPGTLK